MLHDDTERAILTLINRLSLRYQLKKKKSPLKARKRLISGLNEVIRASKSKLDGHRPRLVVIAVDVQVNPLECGTDDTMHKLICALNGNQIPYYFACTRTELGVSLYGKVMYGNKVKCACVAIVDYQGSEVEMTALTAMMHDSRSKFNTLTN